MPRPSYLITRQIGIDAAHRLPDHAGKCRSLHGHRFTVTACCASKELSEDGEQNGMVLDLDFVKQELLAMVHEPCDHGTVLWAQDPLVPMLYPEVAQLELPTIMHTPCSLVAKSGDYEGCEFSLISSGHCEAGKLALLDVPPTAENLSAWWFYLLKPRITIRSDGDAYLHSVTVAETPNCSATHYG